MLKVGSATWNDEMYLRHPTPYESGLAAKIQWERVKQVMNFANLERTSHMLELGCESGRLLNALPDCARKVGFDISLRALSDAQKLMEKNNHSRVEFVHGSAEETLPFKRGEFEVIISSEMIEHVPNPRKVLENIHHLCTPETRVIITVPIEKPKLVIKSILSKLGLLKLIAGNIEESMSEWHLHEFDKKMFLNISTNLFRVVRHRNIWGMHHLFELRAIPVD